MTDLTAEKDALELATLGAQLLDGQVPDWACKIDVETLDMADCSACVLGQLYADDKTEDEMYGFDAGVRVLDLEFASEFGFDVPEGRDRDYGYEDLNEAWERLIEVRCPEA